MATNLVRIDTIPEKWKAFVNEANINKNGFDTNGNNKDWIDAKEAKILEQKIRAYYEYNGNGFDPVEGQVSKAMMEIGITDALAKNNTLKIWKKFTDGCSQMLSSFYKFIGVEV